MNSIQAFVLANMSAPCATLARRLRQCLRHGYPLNEMCWCTWVGSAERNNGIADNKNAATDNSMALAGPNNAATIPPMSGLAPDATFSTIDMNPISLPA